MPIINLCKATDEGATGMHIGAGYRRYDNATHTYTECPGPVAVWTKPTHIGVCLFERERNMHDDSDFFMTVWDDAKQEPEEIMFATTRGWTYPCLASRPDATPEVKAKYEAWLVARQAEARVRQRKAEATKARALRKAISDVAKANGLPYSRLLKLRRAGHIEAMLRLFGPRVSSKFKLSCRKQLVEWLKQDKPKYPTPLSKKQMEYII